MEKTKPIGNCLRCGSEFFKIRDEHKFCSRNCAHAYNQQKARDLAKVKSDCPHNDGLICAVKKCDTCGWNPEVASRRLAML